MESTEFVGSCLSCQKQCLEASYKDYQSHPNLHIRYQKQNFQKKLKQANHFICQEIVSEKSRKFKTDLVQQIQLLLKSKDDKDTKKIYYEVLSSDACVSPSTPEKFENAMKGNYTNIKCCEIAMIDTMSVNLAAKKEDEIYEHFMVKYIGHLKQEIQGLVLELAKRYVTGSLQQKLRSSRNKLPMPTMGLGVPQMGYFPPTGFNQYKGNTPPMMMPPPNIQPPQIINPPSYNHSQNVKKSDPPSSKQEQQKKQTQKKQEKVNRRDPRNIREANNKDTRRPPRRQNKNDEEPSAEYTLINKAKQNTPEFTIKVNIIDFDVLPDNRFRVNIQDESGKGVLIISKNQKILENQHSIIIDKCKVVPYKGQNQIRADKNSVIKVSHEKNPYFNQEVKNEAPQRRNTRRNRDQNQGDRQSRRGRGRGRGDRNRNRIQRPKAEFKNIADIDPGQYNLNLKVKVVTVTSVNAKQNQILCKLGDETGTVNAILPYQLQFIEEGKNLIMYSVQAEVINEHIKITTVPEDTVYEDEEEVIKKSVILPAKHSITTVKLDNNISDKSWVEDNE